MQKLLVLVKISGVRHHPLWSSGLSSGLESRRLCVRISVDADCFFGAVNHVTK